MEKSREPQGQKAPEARKKRKAPPLPAMKTNALNHAEKSHDEAKHRKDIRPRKQPIHQPEAGAWRYVEMLQKSAAGAHSRHVAERRNRSSVRRRMARAVARAGCRRARGQDGDRGRSRAAAGDRQLPTPLGTPGPSAPAASPGLSAHHTPARWSCFRRKEVRLHLSDTKKRQCLFRKSLTLSVEEGSIRPAC